MCILFFQYSDEMTFNMCLRTNG